MAGWLKRAKAWQRLWVLASLIGLGVGGVVLPQYFEKERLQQLAEARSRVIADFELPICQPVRSTPYTLLEPVPAGAPCHDIYVWRKDVKEKLPLILTNVIFPIEAHRREILFSGALKGIGLMSLISAVAYIVLAIGFRRRAHQQ